MAVSARATSPQMYQPGRLLKESSATVATFVAPPPGLCALMIGLAVPLPPGLPCDPTSHGGKWASRKAQKKAAKASNKETTTPGGRWSAEKNNASISDSGRWSARQNSESSSDSGGAAVSDGLLSDTDISTAVDDQDGCESSAASVADIVNEEAPAACPTLTLSEDFAAGIALGSPQCPTIGSRNHRLGHTCKPCPFTECAIGVSCKFCHLCEPGIAHLHLTGNCRPCLFVHKPEGCKQGEDCKFCHFEHDARTTHRRHLRNRQKKSKADTAASLATASISLEQALF